MSTDFVNDNKLFNYLKSVLGFSRKGKETVKPILVPIILINIIDNKKFKTTKFNTK